MLILFTLILLAIGAALMMNIYSIFTPFIENLGDIKDYNIAYYGALGSVERAQLALKYHSAGFEGSGGWMGDDEYGRDADGKISEFTSISNHNNGMTWEIKSRTDGMIPAGKEGDIPAALRSADSQNYNTLEYTQAQEIALRIDKTKLPRYFYNESFDPANQLNFTEPRSVQIKLRLPPKLKEEMGDLADHCTAMSIDVCDADENNTANDNIVLRTMFGEKQLSASDAIPGSCGDANGDDLTSPPGVNNACEVGVYDSVVDTGVGGEYQRECRGYNGGVTANCSANHVETIDGECGDDDGALLINTPINLCNKGIPSAVIDNGVGDEYTWTCAGENEGNDVNCSASHVASTDGVCGPADGDDLLDAPSPAEGCFDETTFVDLIDNGLRNTFNWTCEGTYGGNDVNCSANHVQQINGICGADDGKTLASTPTNLCNAGNSSAVTDNGVGSTYVRACIGEYGGSTDSCSANHEYIINGSCGADHDGDFTNIPMNLCNAGNPSAVTDNGVGSTYDWTCAGDNGGDTADCSANHVSSMDGDCGSAHETTTYTKPTTNLCNTTYGIQWVDETADEDLAYDWKCLGSYGGDDALCYANKNVDGDCGSADGISTYAQPSTNLCNVGNLNWIDESAGDNTWNWDCEGIYDGTDDNCSANQKVDGQCGTSNGTNTYTKPTTNLCAKGTTNRTDTTATDGTWNWRCFGLNGGTTSNCSANKSQNATCGSSHGGTYTTRPTSNLCGVYSSITWIDIIANDGTWNRRCNGVNGGNNANCNATKQVYYKTCLLTKNAGNTTDGYYWIDPDGGDSSNKIKTYCDMSNGGRTLVLRGVTGDSTFNDTVRRSDSEMNISNVDETSKSFKYSTTDINDIRAAGSSVYKLNNYVYYKGATRTDKDLYFPASKVFSMSSNVLGNPYNEESFSTTFGLCPGYSNDGYSYLGRGLRARLPGDSKGGIAIGAYPGRGFMMYCATSVNPSCLGPQYDGNAPDIGYSWTGGDGILTLWLK